LLGIIDNTSNALFKSISLGKVNSNFGNSFIIILLLSIIFSVSISGTNISNLGKGKVSFM